MPGNLASLLFEAYRRDALALLLLHPETSLHVHEIARGTGKAPGTLLRELNRLADAGVLIRKSVGNQVHFKADAGCAIYEDLRNLLKKTVGVVDVLRETLAPLADKIQVAFVYGSVARGDERARSDLGLMIIGRPNSRTLYRRSAMHKRRYGARSIPIFTRYASSDASWRPASLSSNA